MLFAEGMQAVLTRPLARIVDVMGALERSVTNSEEFSCPRCQCTRHIRSSVRWYEQWRKPLSASRPYRCEACRHRTWLAQLPSPVAVIQDALQPTMPAQVDLTGLDAAIAATSLRRLQTASQAAEYLQSASIDWQMRALIDALAARATELRDRH